MDILAGIDGGGTGTTLLVESRNGQYSEIFRFGAFNLNSIGEERFQDLLYQIFMQIKACGDCHTLCIGAAGASNPRLQELIEQSVHQHLRGTTVLVKGDHEIALYGATNGKPGAILISGTGSICTGMGQDGKVTRAGGFGHLIDDFGSGYSLGKDALSAIVCAEDGRDESTELKELVMEQWHIFTIYELIRKTYETSDKSRIASLSRVVEQGARQGDQVAVQIIRKNAEELLRLIQAVYQSVNVEDTEIFSLSLMGGMLTNKTMLLEALEDLIRQNYKQIKIVKPHGNAVEGALLMARTVSR